jgi:hypothetical protein
MAEKDGLPVALRGITVANFDEEKLRLESLLKVFFGTAYLLAFPVLKSASGLRWQLEQWPS